MQPGRTIVRLSETRTIWKSCVELMRIELTASRVRFWHLPSSVREHRAPGVHQEARRWVQTPRAPMEKNGQLS